MALLFWFIAVFGVGWFLGLMWDRMSLGLRIGWHSGDLSAREEWASLEDRERMRRKP